MSNGEFALAKIKHQTWRLRLRSFLLGSNGVREAELVSPRECALGKWIYTIALSKYTGDPDLRTLEQEHVRLHDLAANMVRLKNEGASSEALTHLAAFQSLSDRIISLLNTVGERVDPAKS